MDRYVLKLYPDFSTAKQNQYAAIINADKRELRLLVIYDRELFSKKNYHLMSSSAKLTGTDHHFCLVTMDGVYLDFFRRMPEIVEPILMHELGHFVNGDWDPVVQKKTSKQVYQERIMLDMIGQVPKEELRADRFAAESVGIENMINALRILKKERERKKEEGTELAIKEFGSRIKALEKLRNENAVIFYKKHKEKE